MRYSRLFVEATDSRGLMTRVGLDLWLILQNSPPTLTVPGDQTVKVGETLRLNIQVSSEDGGEMITLVASGLPPGATFTVSSFPGLFTWTPTADQVGTYTVKFTATDDGVPLMSDTKTVKITVK